MSTQHPITPSPELVLALRDSAPHGIRDAGVSRELWLIDHAYAAGADMQLDVVLAKLTELCPPHLPSSGYADRLRALCRPKPPSLKEKALAVLDDCADSLAIVHENTIRRALEALPDDN
jgi:hypothetical protein